MTTFVSSLKVPNVQEMSKEKPSSVPARYIRPDSTKVTEALSPQQIPVVDMQNLLSTTASAKKELENLHFACQEWGFFQLVNHGVSSPLVEKVKAEMQNFFNLPLEEKKKFEQQPGDVEGYGQNFVMSEEQRLDWADMLMMVTLPTHLRKPHLFPKLPLAFREALEEYSSELKDLALKVLNQMTKALKMKPEDMEVLFGEGMQSMRMNYYPPCPQPELVTGLCSHSDAVGLTILLQVNEVEGLQVKKDGVWVPIVPLPNAFIVNIGDNLEIVTNSIYKSIEHRVTVNSQSERLSIATFLQANKEGDVGPAPSLISPENPPKFRRISMVDYLRLLFSRERNGKSLLDKVRI